MMVADPERHRVLAMLAEQFNHPKTPVEFRVTVDQMTAERIEAFTEAMSERVEKEVSTGAVVAFAVDILWSKWVGES